MSVVNLNPNSLFGGTWVQWGKGRVPVGVSSDANFNTVEKIGGEMTNNLSHSHTVNNHTHATVGHALTVSELAPHIHGLYVRWGENQGAQGTHGAWGIGNYGGTFSGAIGTELMGSGTPHNHGNTGGSTPGTNSQLGTVSNLQPYITCYMWKRTA